MGRARYTELILTLGVFNSPALGAFPFYVSPPYEASIFQFSYAIPVRRCRNSPVGRAGFQPQSGSHLGGRVPWRCAALSAVSPRLSTLDSSLSPRHPPHHDLPFADPASRRQADMIHLTDMMPCDSCLAYAQVIKSCTTALLLQLCGSSKCPLPRRPSVLPGHYTGAASHESRRISRRDTGQYAEVSTIASPAWTTGLSLLQACHLPPAGH